MVFVWILLLLVLVYAIALHFLRQQWLNIPIPAARQESVSSGCKISIIVVVRNEAKNLPSLFEALNQQTLAPKLFELHLVDDASEDNSRALAESFRKNSRFTVHLHQLAPRPAGSSPKKAAISQVLPHTRANLIVVTDGDCQPEVEWLSKFLQLSEERELVFISGAVRFTEGHTFFEALQKLEFASLIGIGAAQLQAGSPGMCNAASMAFSKDAFLAVGGYEGNAQVPSGDDEFLLQKLFKQYPERVGFLKAADTLVHTQACGSWQGFFHQRRRWAGKWRLHKGWQAKLPALAVFLFYLPLAMAYFSAVLQPGLAGLVLLILAIKAAADLWFLYPVLKYLKIPLSLPVFLVMELIYPFYVLFFAVAAQWGSFQWKGRSYRYATTAHE